MFKLLIVLSLLNGTFLNTNGSINKDDLKLVRSSLLKTDSSNVQRRKFASRALQDYKKSPEFNYRTNKANDSWWDRFWDWVWRLIEKLFGNKTTGGQTHSFPLLNYIAMAALVGLIIYIIIKIIGSNNIFRQESKPIDVPYTESIENIHQITFDEEIEKAVAQRNYRFAVRLLYLRSLKQLNDAHIIRWQIEKTNSTYLNEIANTEQKQSFNTLTRQFEYIWYGNFPIDMHSFKSINDSFIDFKKMLS